MSGERQYSRHKPFPLDKTLRKAGEHNYREAVKVSRKELPEFVKIELLMTTLLRCAGLSAETRNLRALNSSLSRLTRPIQINGHYRPPLLRDISKPLGLLQLYVDSAWLDPPYGKVEQPLPIRSSHGLALYLFLQSIDTSPTPRMWRSDVKRMISTNSLCEIMGLNPNEKSAYLRRAVDRALQVVNDHVKEWNANIDRYDVKTTKEGRHIRFEAVPPPTNTIGV